MWKKKAPLVYKGTVMAQPAAQPVPASPSPSECGDLLTFSGNEKSDIFNFKIIQTDPRFRGDDCAR